MKIRRYGAGLMALTLLAVGCSKVFGVGDGDEDREMEAETARQLQEQIQTYLRVEGTYAVVRRNGVDVVEPTLKVTNTGTEPIRAVTGMFPWWLRAYTAPDRTGTPVWRSEDVISGGPDSSHPFEIAAGGTLIVARDAFLPIPVSTLVGSRPSGTYYFAVRLELSEPAVRTGEMVAGDIALPNPPSQP